MDKFAYIVSSAASNTKNALARTANDLANVSTYGFKADLERMKPLNVNGPGLHTRSYAELRESGFDAREGSLLATGNALDMAVVGEGFFRVQDENGNAAMTRRGDFQRVEGGLLRNGEGALLMGGNGPISVPPAEKVIIGDDGTISVQLLGAAENELAVIDRVALVNPDTQAVKKSADGLFVMREGGDPPPPDAAVRMRSGTLESSNVNTVQSMVEMIEHQRAFQAQMKVLEKADILDRSASNLMRVS